MRLHVKVVPGSSREGIAGWLGEALKVRVRAPAERGKANAAVEKLVETALDLPRGCASIVSGRTSAHKILEITGVPAAELARRLSRVTETP